MKTKESQGTQNKEIDGIQILDDIVLEKVVGGVGKKKKISKKGFGWSHKPS